MHTQRDLLVEFADALLLATRPYFTESKARVNLPGPTSISGFDSDGLEGYARTLLLAGFRVVGEDGRDPHGYMSWYREGLINGTTPHHPDAWPQIEQVRQTKVEAASICLILDMTRPWIWDTLTSEQQKNVINYFRPVVGNTDYPPTNWLWFRVVVETFLRSVGGPWSAKDIRDDLELYESFYRKDGWYSDGPHRSYDHYIGWAMHLYPILWERMVGARDLVEDVEQFGIYRQRLSRYLDDAVHLIGGDGAPVALGRSLTYRFATAAPLWVGAIAGIETDLGRLRQAAVKQIDYFRAHSVPNREGLLDIGWFHNYPQIRQAYSGCGSPYWAAKGLIGLMLPEGHPLWCSPSKPLPVECGDFVRAIKAPGWIVNGTQADGIVRVYNHGTDRGNESIFGGDLPEYTRLGYSTSTMPCFDRESYVNPEDQSVVLADDCGELTHRAGMRVTDIGVTDGTGYLASVTDAHWLREAELSDDGCSVTGQAEHAAKLTIVSLVKHGWEIRLIHLRDISPIAQNLRVSGWPLGESTLVNSLLNLSKIEGCVGEINKCDASPIAAKLTIPTIQFPLRSNYWYAVASYLGRPPVPAGDAIAKIEHLSHCGEQLKLQVRWKENTDTTDISVNLSQKPQTSTKEKQ